MKKLLILSLSCLLTACDPTVVFMEPQPQGKRDLNGFPTKHHGMYMDLDDSSLYIVQKSAILQKYEERVAMPLPEILADTELDLVGDSLLLKDLGIRYKITRRNDSVFGRLAYFDTIINLEDDSKLRKMGKSYFLNQTSDTVWMVLKISFDRSGKAYLCDIDHEKEIGIIGEYTDVGTEKNDRGDIKKYLLSPTKKEFKKLLQHGVFSDTSEFIRVSQD